MRLFALFRKRKTIAAPSFPLLAISRQSGESIGFRRSFSGRVICFEGVGLDGKGGLTPFSKRWGGTSVSGRLQTFEAVRRVLSSKTRKMANIHIENYAGGSDNVKYT
ncbi:hypothetical protein [Geobacillus sp. GHH01]|uniref:hypothetical protein n=1 Tax=Geobacillus sp. GHH01 TaxID=1233873 RepID=UPI001181C3A8|nr:hypothetical protein [Geobacillus sp. GHH01]